MPQNHHGEYKENPTAASDTHWTPLSAPVFFKGRNCQTAERCVKPVSFNRDFVSDVERRTEGEVGTK